MTTFDVAPGITLTLTPRERYLPDDMHASRHAHTGAWDRTTWECVASEHGTERLRDTIDAPAHHDAATVAAAFAAFVTAAASQYRAADMGIGEPDDEWMFGSADAGEFAYRYEDEFAIFGLDREADDG